MPVSRWRLSASARAILISMPDLRGLPLDRLSAELYAAILSVSRRSMSCPRLDSRLSAMPSRPASATLASVPRYCEVVAGSSCALREVVCETAAW